MLKKLILTIEEDATEQDLQPIEGTQPAPRIIPPFPIVTLAPHQQSLWIASSLHSSQRRVA